MNKQITFINVNLRSAAAAIFSLCRALVQRITSFRQSRCQPEKDDILATSIDTQRDSDESVISNKAVHFTDGLFLSTLRAVGRLLLY
jgi:hypothetical protein